MKVTLELDTEKQVYSGRLLFDGVEQKGIQKIFISVNVGKKDYPHIKIRRIVLPAHLNAAKDCVVRKTEVLRMGI